MRSMSEFDNSFKRTKVNRYLQPQLDPKSHVPVHFSLVNCTFLDFCSIFLMYYMVGKKLSPDDKVSMFIPLPKMYKETNTE